MTRRWLSSAVFAALACLALASQEPATERPVPAPAPPKVDLVPRYFEACDHDGNGWIAYREAQQGLNLDRIGFGVYDSDEDGRVTLEEFRKRYDEIVARTGGFRPPRSARLERTVPTRNAEQLKNAYDLNSDHGLDLDELTKLLRDYEREQIPPEVVLEKIDRDGTKKLEGEELFLFSQLLSATYVPDEAAPDPSRNPKSIEELFARVKERDQGLHVAPIPPQITGPVSHFRRLDLDGDGRIELEDLQRLQSPVQLSVRAGAVLAALDKDQDGSLDQVEFLQSLGSTAK